MSQRRTHDAEVGSYTRPANDDDKNRKAMWEAEGGEPLYMLPRFKMLKFKFVLMCIVLVALAGVCVGIVYKNAPPKRIFVTTIMLGVLGPVSIVPVLVSCMNYKSSDEIIIWFTLLANMAMLATGFSLVFILEDLILPRALYDATDS